MMKKEANSVRSLSDTAINSLCERLLSNDGLTESLPGNGSIHNDRPLPFLAVFRPPLKHGDPGTEKLITGEASYLIASADVRFEKQTSKLIQCLVKPLTGKFNAVLIVEIWAAAPSLKNRAHPSGSSRPEFTILTSGTRPPTRTIEALVKSLEAIKINRQKAKVTVTYGDNRCPSNTAPLMQPEEARKLNCFIIGLEIAPIYRDSNTGEVYPVLLRMFQRRFAHAQRRGFFEFSRSQTTFRPANYLALGKRTLVNYVLAVDRKLAEISNSFDFLLQVTPVNIKNAWKSFSQSNFKQKPVFYYRPLPIDPAFIKQKLYKIILERVEDPTLAHLFRLKRRELDRELGMLEDRETERFLYGGIQLYGKLSNEFVTIAKNLLLKIPKDESNKSEKCSLDASQFAKRVQEEIEYYRQINPKMTAQVEIRADVIGLMVSKGNLLIGEQTVIPASRVDALLAHEIGTHSLTWFNGKAQPFQQLYTGLPGYDELQEGLAVLSEYLVGGLTAGRLRLLAGRVVAAKCLVDGGSFVNTFQELIETYGFGQQTSFTITSRIFRGGGLIKDAVYLRGLVYILDYVKNGGKIAPLYVGKIAAEHLPMIEELRYRKVLRPVPLTPKFLKDPKALERLDIVRKGLTVLELVP